jgi:hypothetical protein
MTSLRRFTADDLFKFANVNLDHLTETVHTISMASVCAARLRRHILPLR